MPEPIPGTTTPPAAETSWFAGFDDTTKAHMTAKGYDKLDAPTAFLAAHEAYKGVESKLGIPADRVLKLPDPADAEGWKAVHTKLGVPADANGYDFSTVKNADGTSLPETTVSWLKENALKLNMTPAAATGWATALLGRDTAEGAAVRQRNTVALAAEQAQLDADWGGAKVRNEFLAQRAAAMLGYSAQEFEAIRAQPGFSAKLKGFVSMATKMGEAELIGGGAGGGFQKGVMSNEEALARHNDIMQGRDKAFTKRLYGGDQEAKKEWAELTALVTRARMQGARAQAGV